MTTATATIPCPFCLRDPQVEVPVEFEKAGDEWICRMDGDLLWLGMIVHRKQHER